jgi:hypothetical protein
MTREIVLLYHLANIPLSCHDEKTTELTQRSHNVVGPQFNWEPSRYQRKCLGTRHIIYPTAVLIEVLFIGSQFSNLYPVLDLIQNRRLRRPASRRKHPPVRASQCACLCVCVCVCVRVCACVIQISCTPDSSASISFSQAAASCGRERERERERERKRESSIRNSGRIGQGACPKTTRMHTAHTLEVLCRTNLRDLDKRGSTRSTPRAVTLLEAPVALPLELVVAVR